MTIGGIRQRLQDRGIFLAATEIGGKPSVIGYEKKFRWMWFATQMNTFVIASDLGDEIITEPLMVKFLDGAFKYAKKNYRGWPRGLQSGFGVIAILISRNVEEAAAEYCRKMKTGKKFAGFAVPVVVNAQSKEVIQFEKDPFWGKIYYPYFRELIDELLK